MATLTMERFGIFCGFDWSLIALPVSENAPGPEDRARRKIGELRRRDNAVKREKGEEKGVAGGESWVKSGESRGVERGESRVKSGELIGVVGGESRKESGESKEVARGESRMKSGELERVAKGESEVKLGELKDVDYPISKDSAALAHFRNGRACEEIEKKMFWVSSKNVSLCHNWRLRALDFILFLGGGGGK